MASSSSLFCSPQHYLSTTKSSQYCPHGQVLGVRKKITWLARSSMMPIKYGFDGSVSKQRPSANYQPTTWSYEFVQSLKTDTMVKDKKNIMENLEEKVKGMIGNEKAEMMETLEFINHIQRLGLGSLFAENIKGANARVVPQILLLSDIVKTENMHAQCLAFRLLRQFDLDVPQDMLKSFKALKRRLEPIQEEDLYIKGILSLYEASYVGFEGEDVLDEANLYAKTCLKNLKSSAIDKEQLPYKLISHALALPLHQTMQLIEARWYIEACSQQDDISPDILELAKFHFNSVQSNLQRDLQVASRWWNNLGLSKKLSFSRDRIMECFFWSVGMVPETQFNTNCRVKLTKIATLITTIDNVYDAYGTLDELQLFTEAVERWDVTAINYLPDYMKLCFLALYNTVNEMAYEALKEKGQNTLPYLTKAWKDLCKSFLKEAKWSYEKSMPKFEEYLENGWVSSSGSLLLISAFFLTTETTSKEALECLENYHNLLRFPSMVLRLSNDLATSKLERGETVSSISCYMKEKRVIEEQARAHIRNMVDEIWKKMNSERGKVSCPFPKAFTETALNLARTAQCIYQYGDAHGAPNKASKKQIESLIIQPFYLRAETSGQVWKNM